MCMNAKKQKVIAHKCAHLLLLPNLSRCKKQKAMDKTLSIAFQRLIDTRKTSNRYTDCISIRIALLSDEILSRLFIRYTLHNVSSVWIVQS